MRELGMQPCQPRPWRHSLTDADPAAGPIPDLLSRDFTARRPGEKLVGDVTYIPTWEGWVDLATVIDCHTKAVIGWAMDDNYKTALVERAIRMAARNYDLPPARGIPLRPRQQLYCTAVRPGAEVTRHPTIRRAHRNLLRQ